MEIDGAVLALLWLTLYDGFRASNSFNWATMNGPYEKGFICDPVNMTKSVVLAAEGLQKAEELLKALFTRQL